MLPHACSLPQMAGGSASALSLSRPALASLCYGPTDRSAAQGDLCHEAPALPVTQPSRSSATGPIDNYLGEILLHWWFAPSGRTGQTGHPKNGQMLIMASRAEEFHLRALPEPYVNLSIHTAPDVRPLAQTASGFTPSMGSSCCRMASVDPWPRLNNAAPSVQPHYRAFVPTTRCRRRGGWN